MTYPSDYTSANAKSLELARLAIPLMATYATPYTDAEVREAVRAAQRVLSEAARTVAEGAKMARAVDERTAATTEPPEAPYETHAFVMRHSHDDMSYAHRMVCERIGYCHCTPSRPVAAKPEPKPASAVRKSDDPR